MGIFGRLFGREDESVERFERVLLRCQHERSVAAQDEMLRLLLQSKLFLPSLRDAATAKQEFSMIVMDTAQGPR